MNGNRVLVLEPHTDDGALGAGGVLHRLAGRGYEVHALAFDTGNPETGACAVEWRAALDVLGVQAYDAWMRIVPTRYYPSERQTILDALVEVRAELDPAWVFCPCSSDIHQDHHVLYEEARRAFRTSTVLGYELPYNCPYFAPTLIWQLDEENIDAKLKALACFESQAGRPYMDPEVVRGLARVRGMGVKQPWAEAFEVIRWVQD